MGPLLMDQIMTALVKRPSRRKVAPGEDTDTIRQVLVAYYASRYTPLTPVAAPFRPSGFFDRLPQVDPFRAMLPKKEKRRDPKRSGARRAYETEKGVKKTLGAFVDWVFD